MKEAGFYAWNVTLLLDLLEVIVNFKNTVLIYYSNIADKNTVLGDVNSSVLGKIGRAHV